MTLHTSPPIPRSFAVAVTLLAMFLCVAPARAAGLLVADGGNGGVLQIKDHDVHVTINNGVAVTTVTQVFQNTENRQVEALYTFPVPKGASVANFSMWINGKEMVGEVVEKQRAREIYNSYKQVRRDPGLLEQTDYRTFEMRVFPIGPKAEQKVQVTYYQELDVDHDWATYVYPLATTTRGGREDRAAGRFALTVDAKSAVPITAMESPSHPQAFAIARHDAGYYQASLEAKGADLGRDAVVAYHLSRPKTGVDLITSRQGGEKNEDGYFCLTLTAGQELAEKDAGMDYVFLLDVSGSMNDDGKLDLSRNALSAFIGTLAADDRFEVMTFNVQPQVLFNKLALATDANRKRAANFLGTQQARGGTVLNPALTTAYKYAADRPLNVLVLSDGLTEQGDRAILSRLIAGRPKGSRVFCIGVGNDVDRGMLQKLSDDAGGLAAFLSKEDNFARQAGAFKRKLMHPVATDLKVSVAGVEVYDAEPKQLPNLYHGMPVRLYGRYRGDGGPAQVTFSGTIDGQPLRQTVDLTFPKQDAANPEIERMWAWHKVDRLLNQDRADGSTGAIDEIIRLGEGYSIATEYTSFLVLENDAEFQRWHIARRNGLRLARDRDAQAKVAADLDAVRSKAANDLGPVAAADKAAEAAQQLARQAAASPQQGQQPAPGQQMNTNGNSRDLAVPRVRGGGAVDPVGGAIALALGGLAAAGGLTKWAAQRRARGART